jgi:hypothetical protein
MQTSEIAILSSKIPEKMKYKMMMVMMMVMMMMIMMMMMDDDDDVEYHSDLASNTWDSANKNGVFHQQTTLTNDN